MTAPKVSMERPRLMVDTVEDKTGRFLGFGLHRHA